MDERSNHDVSEGIQLEEISLATNQNNSGIVSICSRQTASSFNLLGKVYQRNQGYRRSLPALGTDKCCGEERSPGI